jgi:hypothetical protein
LLRRFGCGKFACVPSLKFAAIAAAVLTDFGPRMLEMHESRMVLVWEFAGEWSAKT